ncbi:hypothetical protein RFI_37097 [Reticulomyxa filosa]|uniref:Uncharacterized protein n=1 Tax=Reticulomyxa filosa TaxID=46433 RepID=X6LI18_RETFI|nr:hypothetical protein RFI_37097 [Reticulomyxa filosa]|eukprot:ETO00350.1 hypothetical protein RFI_37097 [Reticulomyxa filosa]
MVDRLTLILSSNSEYFEMSLVIGHEDHSIYLRLYINKALFSCNDINVKHKEYLKNYIKDAFILRNNKSSEVMKHLYCSNIFPCKEKLPSIVENWSYRPAQGNAENCYLRNHNIGYRIRLGDIIYEWFRNREGKSFLLNKGYLKFIILYYPTISKQRFIKKIISIFALCLKFLYFFFFVCAPLSVKVFVLLAHNYCCQTHFISLTLEYHSCLSPKEGIH